MEYTNFGQIDIYNEYFKDLDVSSISFTPTQCIENKYSYCGLYNGKTLPIMIGSKFSHKDDNPLKINGYFIINGLCYSMNNIILKIKNNFDEKYIYLTDGTKIQIKSLTDLIIYNKGSSRKWSIPLNWIDIVKKSYFKEELNNHFTQIDKFKDRPNSEKIKNEVDFISLAMGFECWLGLLNAPDYNIRLITPGEIIYDILNRSEDIIKCFTTSNWRVKHIQNITCVSELMKHYNLISDIESIRRITYPTIRENMVLNDRQVKFNEKYKICPIQSPDGKLCGTVRYLVKDAKLTTKDIKLPKLDKGNNILFLNSEYYNNVSDNYINILKDKGADIINIRNIYYASTLKGRIIKSKNILSYTANFIPYIYNNPPVRSTFVTSMLKQAIQPDNRYNNVINDTKTLINKDLDFKNSKILLAVMPWFGYNIEDSLVISSRVSELYKYKRQLIYRNSNKILKVFVKKGDCVYKHMMLFKSFDPKEIETIHIEKAIEDGVVSYIKKSDKYIKIVVDKILNLQVGDKMTSLHGQKGVISLILPLNEMPYINRNGKKEIIDIIMNPHAYPSRMTIGQIKELGEQYYHAYIKGIKVKNKILAGDCVYLALRHQVNNKLQFCNNDSFNPITLQTLEGKKNNGGLRFGQMERDILLALEAFNTLKEIWSIDVTDIPICPKSGKFYPKCCKEYIKMNQFFVICLSFIRALEFDITLKDNKYSIIEIDKNLIEVSDTKYFGEQNPSEVKIHRDIIMLPLCLRSNYLNLLYSKPRLNKQKIKKETRKLLVNKNGAYHKLFEGHRSNHCMRSVITPDPTLPLDVVSIPIGVNIGTNYCILNRQPTLNISSLRLMKIKYKKEKTISFNPLLCESFNADFDGDEMNLYGIKNEESIKELEKLLTKENHDTQDYILCKYLKLDGLKDLVYLGITFSKNDMKLMVESGAKGKEFNIEHIFVEIGKVKYNDKEYYINECYYNGLSENNWYILSMITRNNTASIALNTPISGYLQTLCNEMLL
nr:RNA polymerase [Saccharomycopsis selenospora]